MNPQDIVDKLCKGCVAIQFKEIDENDHITYRLCGLTNDREIIKLAFVRDIMYPNLPCVETQNGKDVLLIT